MSRHSTRNRPPRRTHHRNQRGRTSQLFDCGNGNPHHVVVRRGLVKPGMIVVGSDSHTPMHGALAVAESFAQTFYRNCFEVGLPADPFLVDMVDAGGLIALAERNPELFG